MQKKSLLVALFCGALCLTGCLKNEESASVAQVRIAKANELNSIAKLNEAKAAAEAVYAQAELTVANAEAKLREAQANLVNAQAETEKVRAELLKVRVALAEVQVEEEKVRLQMLEADLEKKLAEVEAAVAKAEAEKQGWINVLNHAIADAERQAIVDAQAILTAEEALANYVLTLEKDHADSALVAAEKYFVALDSVQALQMNLLKVKAEKALVEAGAIEVRDAIHYAMDRIDEEIAEKEALVAKLKEYQTMTPEEAEEALKAARTALNEAYNEYKAAVEVRTAAEEVFGTTIAKHSDFESDWWDIVNAVQSVPGISMKDVPYYPVKVDDETLYTRAGVVIWNEKEGPIPFISDEARKEKTARYPDIDVVANDQNKHKDHVVLTSYVIAPATIYYDNIQAAMDTVVARKENEVANNIKNFELVNDWWGDFFEASIENNNEQIALHEKYIAARKDSVEKYEAAYLAAVKDVQEAPAEIESAWEAFQEYMLVKHPTLSRSLFINVYEADALYHNAQKDSADKKDDLDKKTAALGENDTTGLRKAVKEAFEAYAKAEGEYKKVQDSVLENTTTGSPAGLVADTLKAFVGGGNTKHIVHPTTHVEIPAEGIYNPAFAASTLTAKPNNDTPAKWYKGESYDSGIQAGEAQNDLLNAGVAKESADSAAYEAQIDFYRGYKTQAQVTAANEAVGDAIDALEVKRKAEEWALAEYTRLYNKLQGLVGVDIEKVMLAYNPKFYDGEIFKAAQFSTVSRPKPVGEWSIKAVPTDDKKNWKEDAQTGTEEARSAQAAVLNAVNAVLNQLKAINTAKDAYDKEETGAKQKAEAAKDALVKAQQALIAAVEGITDPDEIAEIDVKDIEKYLDEDAIELYEAYLDSYDVKYDELWEAWAALQEAYGSYPDYVGTNRPWDNVPERFRNFGWLISNYNVDYEATVINFWGQEVPIAAQLYGYRQDEDGQWVPNYTNSLQYQVEQAQNMIDTVLPQWLADYKKAQQDDIKTLKTKVSNAMAVVNAYKSKEAGYKAWLTDRQNAVKAVNEAKKDEFDAEQVKNLAKAVYDALDAVANEGMWVYDPDWKLYRQIYDRKQPTSKTRSDGFTWITISDEIARLEGASDKLHEILGELIVYAVHEGDVPSFIKKDGLDFKDLDALGISTESIAGLNFAKKLLQEALTTGKVALQVVLDAFDEEIAVIEEKIALYTKLAETYKAVMNAYLGIVEESEGETGPLDGEGEGDDEE